MSRLFVVPAKPLARAKERLSPRLGPDARRRLVLAMLTDVVTAASGAGPVWVLCSDGDVERAAVSAGARVVVDEVPEAGLNASLERALLQAEAEGNRHVAVVASDLPCVTADDLDGIPMSGVALAPSADGTGTNVLALTPPGIIRPAFGPGSRDAHERLARAAGVEPLVVRSARLAADVDTPPDIDHACQIGVGPATAAALEQLTV